MNTHSFRTSSRPLLLALSVLTLAAALQACAPAVIGGAVVGGLVYSDRRTSGAQLEDEGIELRGGARLRDALGGRGHVNITSYNRQVLVTGEVPTQNDKIAVEQVLSRVENVRGVINELGVMENTSLTQRSADALITTKIKAAFVDTKDVQANAFKVVTERGAVYLMGRVTRAEAERATELARTVQDVKRVVRALDIISDQELRQLQGQPASSANPRPTAP
jgi:osmotically-inducible protein OsmY